MNNQQDSLPIGIMVLAGILLFVFLLALDQVSPLPTLAEAKRSILEQYPDAEGHLIVIEEIEYPNSFRYSWGEMPLPSHMYYLVYASKNISIQIQDPN